jgi:superfamily II DNA or RNA helicase
MFKRYFAVNYGAEWTGKFGVLTFNPDSEKAREGMTIVHDYLFNKRACASRLTKADMSQHFTDNHVIADVLNMGVNTDKINSVYNTMERELAELEESSKGYSQHIFAIIMKARRHSELLKIPTIAEHVEETIRNGKSAAVFLNFTESIEALIKRLEKTFSSKASIAEQGVINVVKVIGGQSSKERDAAIQSFQDDSARVIVCNIAAGGTGISLHDTNGKYARESFISPSFSAVSLIQSLGRIHRANGKSACTQKIVYAAKTIEETAAARVQARLNNLSILNDNDIRSLIQFYSPVMDTINWDND